MLSESFLLARALQDAGMSVEAQHPNIKVPGISTGPVIRVCLDIAGGIVRCERVVEDNCPGLWTHIDGNQNSFPIVRLAEPLMMLRDVSSARDEEQRKQDQKAKPSADTRRKALQDSLQQAQPRELSKNTLDLLRRLHDKADMLTNTLAGHQEAVVRVCRAYMLAVPAGNAGSVPLVEGLRERAIEWLTHCDDSELDALDVLLFKASSESGKKKVQLALDIDGGCDTIYRGEVRKTVTSVFLRDDEAHFGETVADDSSMPVCAFTGEKDLWIGPFPKVKLPAFGNEFCLFSMFSEAECNLRYGMKDSQVVPVSNSLVLRMQNAINAVVTQERQGKTWRAVAGEKPGSLDQLITYVDGRPDIAVNVADVFGISQDTRDRQFEADVSSICEALDGVSQQRPGSRVNLFILRKASKGQAFVMLAESPTVDEVFEGAEWWQTAGKNVPLGWPNDGYSITFPILNKDKKPERLKPWVIYPGEVAAMLRNDKLRGTPFSDVLDVMLQRPGNMAAARRILSLCLDHCGPLLCGLGGCQGKGSREAWKACKDTERLTGLRAVSIIGMTLYALGSKKEDYMHESAFQIGRVLALADRLHRCYCTVVRDGSMPPNLIGNAVFATALDCPEKALAILAERMRIYQGWAETANSEFYRKQEEKHIAVLTAKKTLSRYRPLAVQLHRQGLPHQCDDVMKAHLLLGYIAGEDKENETEGADK